MSYIGDVRLGDTFDCKFCTVTTTGAPTQLAGTPVISAYPGNSTTQLTAGITLSVDFDSVTGLNNVRVVATSGNGYATATDYQLVITTGTVGGTSVVGYVVGEFSIEKRSALMPTTAARTLDVTAANKVNGVVLADTVTTYTGNTPQTGDNYARIGAAGAGLTGITGARLSSAGAGDIWDALTSAHTTVGTFGQLGRVPYRGTAQAGAAGTVTLDAGASAIDNFFRYGVVVITSGTGGGQFRTITGYVGSTKVATVDRNWDTNPASDSVLAILPGSAPASAGATAAEVWDLLTSGHTTSGTFGAAMAAAGVAGDPLTSAVPGSYSVGTAGYVIGTNLNATISSRAPEGGGNLAAVKSKTDMIGTNGSGLTAIPWNAAWDAEVESEVNDAIDTAISELGVAAPTATPSLRTGMMLMYMSLRNKLVITPTAVEAYNNAGSKIASKAVTDVSGTYTESKMT